MIKNKKIQFSFSVSLIIAISFHLVTLFFVKKKTLELPSSIMLTTQQSRPLKIDRLQIIKPDELERIKRVGIKNGLKKDFLFPDISKPLKPLPLPSPGLSFGNLAPELPTPKETRKSSETKPANDLKEVTKNNLISRPLSRLSDDGSGHIYFNPKKEKIIRRNQEQDNFKEEAFKNLPVSPNNPVAQKMSNFEIRYERPEGISESELNSDEKAYYSFFKRSYANYLTKLYATYEKISVERPGLEKDFSNKHVLIGRIDYDDKGNIVLVKILKSSDSDDVHYFFEETLKQLNLPNPPKSFIKSKKQFTTYYQIQIN